MTDSVKAWAGATAGATLLAMQVGGPQLTAGEPFTVKYQNFQQVSGTGNPIAQAGGALKMDEALLNAKLEAVEARTDSKFSQLMGEVRVLSANISSMNENFNARFSDIKEEMQIIKSATVSVKWNILAAGIAVGALILGLFAYMQQMLALAAALAGLHK